VNKVLIASGKSGLLSSGIQSMIIKYIIGQTCGTISVPDLNPDVIFLLYKYIVVAVVFARP
jgi:hypothetical protein